MSRQIQFDIDTALDKAMRQFWRFGFHATTMQDLVDAMGINRASMYNTFGDKQALFLQVLEHYHQRLRQQRLKPLSEKHPSLQRIHALFLSWVETELGEDRRWGCLLVNTALEVAPHEPDVQQIVLKAQNSLRYFFIGALQDGLYAKQLREDIDTNAEAQLLIGLHSGLLVQVRNSPDRTSLRTLLDGLDRYLLTLRN